MLKLTTMAVTLAVTATPWAYAAEARNIIQCASAEDAACHKARGRADAEAKLRQGKKELLVPSAPPIEWEYRIRRQEYAKYGIAWTLTGDVIETAFEHYREGFNTEMDRAIRSVYGDGIYKQIEQRIEARIRTEASRAKRKE